MKKYDRKDSPFIERVYSKISNLIPENKLKKRLRNFFYNNAYSFTIGHDVLPLNKEKTILGKFKRTILVNQIEPINALMGYQQHYIPKKGDVIIDVGAYNGDYAIYASNLIGDEGKILCFEPDEANFKLLRKNVKLNKLKNVILIKKGLWNKTTQLIFKTHGPDSKIGKFDKEENLVQKVDVVKLDEFLQKIGINRVDFIKMDIEGAEIEAVEGCVSLMKKNNINFAIASYHVVDGNPTYEFLERFFKKRGYIAKTEYPQHLTTYAWKKKRAKRAL